MSYEKTIYHNRYYNFHPHGMRPHASVVFRMDSCCCRSGDWNVGQRGGVSLARRSCHHALERMPLRMEKQCSSVGGFHVINEHRECFAARVFL